MTRTAQVKPSKTVQQQPSAPATAHSHDDVPQDVPLERIQSVHPLSLNIDDSAPGQVTPPNLSSHVSPVLSPRVQGDPSGSLNGLEPEAPLTVSDDNDTRIGGTSSPRTAPSLGHGHQQVGAQPTKSPPVPPIVTTVHGSSRSSNTSSRDPDAVHADERQPTPPVTPSTNGIPPSIVNQVRSLESAVNEAHIPELRSRSSRSGRDPDASMSWELPPTTGSPRAWVPDPTPSVAPDPFMTPSDEEDDGIPLFPPRDRLRTPPKTVPLIIATLPHPPRTGHRSAPQV